MTTLLRGVLVGSAVALGAGLVLHLAGVPLGDRVISAGLIALVAIPIVSSALALVEEARRRR